MLLSKSWNYRSTTPLLLLLAFAVAACGPSYEAAEDPPEAVERIERRTAEMVEVEIYNTTATEGEAEIYAVPESGTRNYLGLAEAGEDPSILFVPTPDVEEPYRLVAEVAGNEIESEEFTPTAGMTITWDLEANEITSQSPEEMDRNGDRDLDPDTAGDTSSSPDADPERS